MTVASPGTDSSGRKVAVAVNDQGLTRERGLNEPGEDHSVHSNLTRADGIEQTHDDDASTV